MINATTIKLLLSDNILQIEFWKRDGTFRHINGTTSELLGATHYEKKTERTKTRIEDIISVYDLDKKVWRSFDLNRLDNFSYDAQENK